MLSQHWQHTVHHATSLQDVPSMINRQYGVAAPPSIMPVVHPEDSQPNERMPGRNRNLPPKVANTARPPRFDRILSNSGQTFSQYAMRGSGPWRGRGGGPRFSSGRQDMQSRPTYNPRDRVEDHRPRHPESSSRPRTYSESMVHSVSKGPPANIESHLRAEHSEAHPPRTNYQSPSPKLPPDPLRRRTPQDGPPIHSQLPKPSRPPLPGRKRIVEEAPPEAPPPAQKPKVMEAPTRVTPSVVMDESSSHKPIPPRNQSKFDKASYPAPIVPPPKTLHPVVTIKGEPSSPEPTAPSRKLVTEACKFWPIPDNCRKSAPNYSDNRLAYAKEQSAELLKFGLKRTKVFFREDGLVIEWKSELPVWSDTLLPEPPPRPTTPLTTSTDSIGRQGSQTLSPKRKRDSRDVIDVDALPTPIITPKKPRVSRSANSEVSRSSSGKDERPSSTVAPLPRKVKAKNARHWAAGLSQSAIRNLGKRDQSSPSTQQFPPNPSSHSKPSNSMVTPIRSGVEPDTTPRPAMPSLMKRPALPTRINRHQAARKDVELTRPPSLVTPVEKEGRQSPSSSITCPEKSGLSSKENRSLPSTDDNHVLTVTQPISLERAEDNVVPPPAEHGNLKKSIFGDPSKILLLNLPHVSRSDAVADIGSTPIPDESEENQGVRHERLASSERINQDQTLETEQTIMDGSIYGDYPEYEMAQEFIQRFIFCFDSDRIQLQMAYSKDALFSYRMHRSRGGMTSESDTLGLSANDSAKSNSIANPFQVDQGRTEIVQRLSSLENYFFSPRGVSSKTVHYDLAALPRKVVSSHEDPTAVEDEEDVGVILATLHSEIVETCSEDVNLDHTWTLDQSFVLRRRLEEDNDVNGDDSDLSLRSSAKDLWPLVAISHQMTLRDEPLMLSDEFDGVLACT